MSYKGKKVFTKDTIQEVVSVSKSKREAIISLGMNDKATNSYKVLQYYVDLYEIDTSHFQGRNRTYLTRRISLDDILVGDHPLYSPWHLKNRLVKEGVFEWKCSECALTEWRGQPIPLDIDHINGVSYDHRLENLRLLCRNCHAQTDTFCGKNKFKKETPQRDRKTYFSDRKAAYIASQAHLVPIVMGSGIDFSKAGWITKVAPLIGQKPQKVRSWMTKVMPDLLAAACFTRRPGNGRDNH